MGLNGKIAIVTGATAGIGKEIAKTLASKGATVVCVGRNKERGNAVVEEIKANGSEALFVSADITKEENLDEIIKTTLDTYGKIDILVNNAGIAVVAPMEEYPQEQWDAVVDTNLRGPYILIKKIMPHLIESKGNIVNIASISGVRPVSGAYAYSPSKAAVISLTQLLAMDYGKQGVRVNAVCPGTVETEILACVPEEVVAAAAAAVPLGRLGRVSDIAKAAAFLASDDAEYITGQALIVDGGYTL